MSERNTLVRSPHDLGLVVWFGGGLMVASVARRVGQVGHPASGPRPLDDILDEESDPEQ